MTASFHDFILSSRLSASESYLIKDKARLLSELAQGNCLNCDTNAEFFENELTSILNKYDLPVNPNDLENIHNHISPQQAMNILIKIRQDPETINLQTRIMKTISDQFDLPMYIEKEPNIRFHFPSRIVAAAQNAIERKIGTGQLTSHRAHKDSYFFHPRETYNLWFSITRSTPQNGMFVKLFSRDLYPYTDSYKEDFRDISWLNIYTDLNPYQGLLFPAENIHGSILNTSGFTRIAFSMRFSLEKPVPQKGRSYKYIPYKVGDAKNTSKRFNPYKCGRSMLGLILRTRYRSDKQLCSHQGADYGYSSFYKKSQALRCPRHCLLKN